jgi:hypothetical protein
MQAFSCNAVLALGSSGQFVFAIVIFERWSLLFYIDHEAVSKEGPADAGALGLLPSDH